FVSAFGFFFFFFSSRRRHTRFSRDWSSDVCSSDLRIYSFMMVSCDFMSVFVGGLFELLIPLHIVIDHSLNLCLISYLAFRSLLRSEERRVGKECRSWCSPHH